MDHNMNSSASLLRDVSALNLPWILIAYLELDRIIHIIVLSP